MVRARSLVVAIGASALLLVSACSEARTATRGAHALPAIASVRAPRSVQAGQESSAASAGGVAAASAQSVHADVPDAGALEAERVKQPAPLREWSAVSPGSTVLLFRELYVGMLQVRGERKIWSLVTGRNAVLLRVETQISSLPITHLARDSLAADRWSAQDRTEYEGAVAARLPPFTLHLQRRFGAHEPPELVLNCSPKIIFVHPAFATLVEGWKNNDDSFEPASWAPARTERVQALNCKPEAGLEPFGDGLSFVHGKAATATDSEVSGVEWGFVNSDMVIQQGGYRWIPNFSL